MSWMERWDRRNQRSLERLNDRLGGVDWADRADDRLPPMLRRLGRVEAAATLALAIAFTLAVVVGLVMMVVV